MKDVSELYGDETFLSEIINAIPSCVFVTDTEHSILLINKACADMINMRPGECFDRKSYEIFKSQMCDKETGACQMSMGQGIVNSGQTILNVGEKKIPIEFESRPLKNFEGKVVGCVVHFIDITKRLHEEKILLQQKEDLLQKNEEYIRHLQNEILELSTPVIEIWEGIIALPLIGTLDSYRARSATTRLLESIEQTKSSFVIIDITGVPTVDADVAKHILQTVYAVRLLGAEGIISGLSPNIAMTIAQLNLNLEGIEVCGRMADALSSAIKKIQIKKDYLKAINFFNEK